MKKQSLRFFGWTGWVPVCLMAIAGWTLTACSDDDNETNGIHDPFTTDVSCVFTEGDTTLTFQAYGDWKASVTRSDVAEIRSAKSGVAGEVKMVVHFFENKTFAPREAEIRINDGRANAFRIRQAAALRAVNFSKALNFTQTDTLFTDTLVVTSNVVWEVGTMPEWVKSWKKVDNNLMPEDGVNTEIALVFIADNSKFTTAAMSGEIVFTDKANNNYPLPVAFAGFAPSIIFDTDELELVREDGADDYMSKVTVTSNVAWTVDQSDAAFVEEIQYTNLKVGNALVTKNIVWVVMDQNKLDSDPLTGMLVFKDEATGKSASLDIKFVGTGADYINFEREKIFDKSLDAQREDPMGNPIPGAVTSINFDVFAPQGSNCNFVIVGYDGRNPYKQPEEQWAIWAGVDPYTPDESAYKVPETRTPVQSTPWTLWVKPRQAWEQNTDQERHAVLFVVPENVTIDDILEATDTGELNEWDEPIFTYSFKEGYGLENGVLFHQKGLVIDYHLTIEGIDEGSTQTIPVTGATRSLTLDTDCENWSIYCDGEFNNPQVDWVSFEQDGGSWKMVVNGNTTGKTRKTEVSFRAYRGDGVEEQILLTFWISQEK